MLLKIGVDHKRASLAILDALTLRDPQNFYLILRNTPKVKGSVILQTCNRVEFYFDTDGGEDVSGEILKHWALETKFKLNELSRLVEKSVDDQVVNHLVGLGSGLESMLVGEPQILGQLKNALMEASSQKATSPRVLELFEKAVQAAARIRENTGIGKGAVSLGAAVVKLAEETRGPLRDANVLLVGTGQVGMLVMKALRARGITKVRVASRTRERADAFCRIYGGTPVELSQIGDQIPQTDLVIVATRSKSHILTKENLRQTMSGRMGKLAVLDLSSPRNVSPDIAQLEAVSLRNIDDLREVADQAMARRKESVSQAEPMVRQEVERITALLRREDAEPVVSDIYRWANKIRVDELQRALSHLGLTPDQEKIVRNMSVSLVEKILAPPMINLRRAAEKGRAELLTIAGEIFGSA